MREILRLARRIHHQQQMVAVVGDHQIVEDAAGVVGEDRVTLTADAQVDHVDRHQRFECGRGGGTRESHLTHVRDVEKPGGGARVQVLLDDAGRVLHRHVVTRERHHAGAKLAVERVKWCA